MKSKSFTQDALKQLVDEPKVVAHLIIDLMFGADLELKGITSGEGHGAVAQGLGPDDILTTVCMGRDDIRIEISYTGVDVKAAQEARTGRYYGRKLPASVPDAVVQVRRMLPRLGFNQIVRDLESRQRRITFFKGQRKYGLGIRVNVSWN